MTEVYLGVISHSGGRAVITVPKELFEKRHLDYGDKVQWVIDDEQQISLKFIKKPENKDLPTVEGG